MEWCLLALLSWQISSSKQKKLQANPYIRDNMLELFSMLCDLINVSCVHEYL